MLAWLPVLYTWILHLDTVHHHPHFQTIAKQVTEYTEHNNIPFDKKFLLQVFNFSDAQCAAHAEEYADILCSITPGFSALSKAAQQIEHKKFYDEALQAEKGCQFHFWQSAERIKSNGALVPQAKIQEFNRLLHILVNEKTSQAEFDVTLEELNQDFPSYSEVDPSIAIQVPKTSNAAEHSHSLLHHAIGTDQDLIPGIEKLHLHVRQLESQYNAIKDGHYNPALPRAYCPPPKKVYDENCWTYCVCLCHLSSDTEYDLQVTPTRMMVNWIVAEMAGQTRQKRIKLCYIQEPRVTRYKIRISRYERLVLGAWSPNSCFVDAPAEVWFHAYSLWPEDTKAKFLADIPSDSFLESLFFHFDRPAPVPHLQIEQNLGLMQTLTLDYVFRRWKLYPDCNDFGCAKTWLVHAVKDKNTSLHVQGYFGITHQAQQTCSNGHTFSIRNSKDPQILFTLNSQDINIARAIVGGSETTTSHYFAHHTPHLRGRNYTGGTTPVHLLPDEPCLDAACSAPALISSVPTEWPQLLNINADTTINPVRFERTFTIPDENSQTSITYELVGRILHVNGNHFISELSFGSQCYSYNNMENNGALIPSNNQDFLRNRNDGAVFNCYTRTSSKNKKSGMKSVLQDTSAVLSILMRHGYAQLVLILMEGAGTKQLLNFLHIRLGEFILLRPFPTAHFYPAKILGRVLTHQVWVEWYGGNVYQSDDDIPLDPCSIFTALECLQAKFQDNIFLYTKDNLGMIKWPVRPVRLQEDAADTYAYQNQDIHNALEGAYGAVLEILLREQYHPITEMYKIWVTIKYPEKAIPSKVKHQKQHSSEHHFNFTKQFTPDILPGDKLLIDMFMEQFQRDIKDNKMSVDSHSVTCIGSILFCLVVLRTYLGHKPCNDTQIFYLAGSSSLFDNVSEDDTYAKAKKGSIQHIITPPEHAAAASGTIHTVSTLVPSVWHVIDMDDYMPHIRFVKGCSSNGDLYPFFNTTASGLVGKWKFVLHTQAHTVTKRMPLTIEQPNPWPKAKKTAQAAKTNLQLAQGAQMITPSLLAQPSVK
ncbi:hypothetical protein BJ912DRAFT_938259 [Pholiota molesta]|nr:hypothetical protein BJ912DRAFT_938259 [Pholiota molesta]